MQGWKHVKSFRALSEARAWAHTMAAAGYVVRVDLSFTHRRATGWEWEPLYICRQRRSARPRRIFQGHGVGARLSGGRVDKPIPGQGSIRWKAMVDDDMVVKLARNAGLRDDMPRDVVAAWYDNEGLDELFYALTLASAESGQAPE